VARHGRSLRDRYELLRRVGLAVGFLLVVALVPALLVTLPDSGQPPRAAPSGTPVPTTTGPSATPTPSPTRPTPSATTARPTPTRTTPRPRPATTLPAGLPVSPPDSSGPLPPATGFQEFPSVCAPAATGTQGGVAGTWFGLAPGTAGTSCLYGADRSRYWVPAVLQDGAVLAPDRLEAYYKSGIRQYDIVQPFPAGFAMVSGTVAEARAHNAYAAWGCGEGDTAELPASCPANNKLVLRLQGPSCWDGRSLTGTGHLTWPLDDRCPGGYPVPVPKLELTVFYPLPAGAPLRLTLATGRGPTATYRFTDGWTTTELRRLLRTCVNTGSRCDERGVPQ
jgi:hypothetical protein